MNIIDEYLPHKKPVRFIKELIEGGKNHSISLVDFIETPTLSAVVEAAAQNVIFITSVNKDYDGGVLTRMKKVKRFKNLKIGTYRIESHIVAQIDNYANFKFLLSKDGEIYTEGEMNITMKEGSK